MIPKRFHERAYIGILKYVVTGLPTWEPSGGHSVPGYHLSYDKCIEVLHLLEHVEMDNVVYRYIKHVVDSATWKHNRDYPTQEQRNELASMIRRLSSTKFPIRGLLNMMGSPYLLTLKPKGFLEKDRPIGNHLFSAPTL